MTLSTPESENYLKYLQEHFQRSASFCGSEEEILRNRDTVDDLVSHRFEQQLQNIRQKKSTKVSNETRSTSLSSIFFKDDLSDEVFNSCENNEKQKAHFSSKLVLNCENTSTPKSFSIHYKEDSSALLENIPHIKLQTDEDDSVTNEPDIVINENTGCQSETENCCFCCSKTEGDKQPEPILYDEIAQKVLEIIEKTRRDEQERFQFYNREIDTNSIKFKVNDIFNTLQGMYGNTAFEYEKFQYEKLLEDTMAKKELDITQYKGGSTPRLLNIRSICISDIKIFSTKKPEPSINRLVVCVINYGNRIFTTEISESNEQEIIFERQFHFNNLPFDFEVLLRFYELKLKTPSKKHLCTHLVSCLKQNTDDQSNDFILIGEASITMDNLRNGHLSHIYVTDDGRLLITATVLGKAKIHLKLQDQFYYFCKKSGEGPVPWTSYKRWCVLEDYNLKLCYYPNMVDPLLITSINLMNATFRHATQEENPRKWSLLIEVIENDKNCQYFLSNPERSKINIWLFCMEIVVATMKGCE